MRKSHNELQSYRQILVSVGVLLALVATTLCITPAAYAKQAKQLVCHIDEFGEIVPEMLPANAASAHTGHGDPDPQTFYLDADEDLYQSDAPNTSFYGCSAPDERYTALILEGLDCDDDNSNINPGATEIAGNNVDENCDGEVEQATVLARAYIDVNRNGVYDGAIDVNISQLLDSDESGDPTVGDEVWLDRYPLSFDPCPPQTQPNCNPLGVIKNIGPHVVLEIRFQSPETLTVRTAVIEVIAWARSNDDEQHVITTVQEGIVLQMTDNHDPFTEDTSFVRAAGVLMFGDPVAGQNATQVDDYFLNVEFP